MIALPQCYSTSFRWRGALHMLGLEESVSIETTTTVAHGVGGDWAIVFFFWRTMTPACTGTGPRLRASSRDIECQTTDPYLYLI